MSASFICSHRHYGWVLYKCIILWLSSIIWPLIVLIVMLDDYCHKMFVYFILWIQKPILVRYRSKGESVHKGVRTVNRAMLYYTWERGIDGRGRASTKELGQLILHMTKRHIKYCVCRCHVTFFLCFAPRSIWMAQINTSFAVNTIISRLKHVTSLLCWTISQAFSFFFILK